MANRQTFTIAESPEAFKVLSSNLYSNPVLAVIRELSTNAYDAQVVADTNDEHPIEVHIPVESENFFRVRDWGNGLSEDEVFTIYTQFFSSTKRDDDKQVGAFGLGSKSPFAVAKTYYVNSYQNGIVKKYVMSAENSYPEVSLEATEETSEHDGLEVVVPLPSNFNAWNWLENAISLFKGTAFLPNINLSQRTLDEVIEERAHFTINDVEWRGESSRSTYRSKAQLTINVAGVTFPIKDPDHKISAEDIPEVLYDAARIERVNFLSEKFDVTLTPSREELHYDDKTVSFIKKELKNTIKNAFLELDENTKEGLKKLTQIYERVDEIEKAFGKEVSDIIEEKTQQVRTELNHKTTKVLEANSLIDNTKFPFMFYFTDSYKLLREHSKVYYVDFTNATKAQEKALYNMLATTSNVHNNVVNCLASHLFDTLNGGERTSNEVFYIFKKLSPKYTKLFDVKTLKIKDYENFFKRYNGTKEQKEKVQSSDSFINSQTYFFVNGCSAKLEYLKAHKEDFEAKNTKLLKIVGNTYNSIGEDLDFYKIATSFIGEGYVIAYRRGSQAWYEKNAKNPELLSAEAFKLNIRSYNPEKAELIKNLIKLEKLNSGSAFADMFSSSFESIESLLDMNKLSQLQGWKALVNPLRELSEKLNWKVSSFAREYILKEEEYELSDEEKRVKDIELKSFALLDAISFYRVRDEESKAQLAFLVNHLIDEHLAKMAA